MKLKARVEKLEQQPSNRPGPELVLVLKFKDEQERAAAQARFDSYEPGPLKHVCILEEVTP